MAYYKPINLVKGDDLPLLVITLRDSNVAASGKILSLTNPETWEPLDLTNMSTIKMKFRKIDGTGTTHTITCTKNLPYIDGVIVVAWGLTTLDGEAGDYEGEIEITFVGGKVLTIADKFKFLVREQF
tara:strand:+ start:8808 stop:9188 length:381 start_codon:yes stop_codon:yes gene_type:complete